MISIEERKEKLFGYLESIAIDKKEVLDYFNKEYKESLDLLGMSVEDSNKRALMSTTNYYRKYLDKVGNRIKFLCIGISSPTDYGLQVKYLEIKKKYRAGTEIEKNNMILNGEIDINENPLHNINTSTWPDKHGTKINLDEEKHQTLYGIIEKDGLFYPSMIRLNGINACNETKIMYKWCSVSGIQQTNTKNPDFITLNSRELLMKPLIDSKRINMDEYKKMVFEAYKNYIVDVNEESFKDLGSENKLVIIKNGKINSFEFINDKMVGGLYSEQGLFDPSCPIIASLYLSKINCKDFIDLDIDTKGQEDEVYMIGSIRKRKDGSRLSIELHGIYIENPIDMTKYKLALEDLFPKDAEPIVKVTKEESCNQVNNEDFFTKLQRNNLT